MSESKIVQVTDRSGRKITICEPPFLEEFRLIEALGPELAGNSSWMQVFAPLTWIVEIDGEAVLKVRKAAHAEALIALAGREGYSAVIKGIKDNFGQTDQDLDLAKN